MRNLIVDHNYQFWGVMHSHQLPCVWRDNEKVSLSKVLGSTGLLLAQYVVSMPKFVGMQWIERKAARLVLEEASRNPENPGTLCSSLARLLALCTVHRQFETPPGSAGHVAFVVWSSWILLVSPKCRRPQNKNNAHFIPSSWGRCINHGM